MTPYRTILVLVFFVVPLTLGSLVVLPKTAEAQFGGPVSIIADVSATSILTSIKSAVTAIATVTSSIADTAMHIKTWVLDPLAFVLSGNLLRSLTAGVVDFINGNNTSGRPLFVQNLSGHLLNVGDVQAFGFFAEFGRNSTSPFSGRILSSLRTNYLYGSSPAGFWAQNMSTLPRFSQNPGAFVRGDFRQGGWGAWLALTTRPQNNPYSFYYLAQAEYSSRVRSSVHNTLQQLTWGDGFLS